MKCENGFAFVSLWIRVKSRDCWQKVVLTVTVQNVMFKRMGTLIRKEEMQFKCSHVFLLIL